MRRGRKLYQARDRYLQRIASSLRPNTVYNYGSVIKTFIRYLKAEHPQLSSFSELERCHIEAWLVFLMQQPLRRSTRRRSIIGIRRFIRCIQEWEWEDAPRVELFQRGDIPPADRYLPRPLSDETDRLLQQELHQKAKFIPKALLFLRKTGLRIQELLDLKVDALRDGPGGVMSLHVPLGKLHSERVIPISDDAAEIFRELSTSVANAPPVMDPETGQLAHFLIVRPNGRRITRNGFVYYLRKIEQRRQFREHLTLHRLRHTYATSMLRAGMSLPVLMKLLGHRTIGMTLRYAQVTGRDVAQAYMRAMENLEGRYDIPKIPTHFTTGEPTKNSACEAIMAELNTLAVMLESFRRDHATPVQRRPIQRFVERLKRLATDFKGLVS